MRRPTLLLPLVPLVLLLLASAAIAIPTCPTDTLAAYIALPSTGCQFGELTFSNFSSIHQPFPFVSGVVFVTPSLPYGLGSARLTFTTPDPAGLFLRAAFDVAGNITADELLLVGNARLFTSTIDAGLAATPGGSLSIVYDPPCGFPPDAPRHCDPFFQSMAFDPVAFQHIAVDASGEPGPFGGFVDSVTVGVVTPEPTTILLWGTSTAGLGLARRLRCRPQLRPHRNANPCRAELSGSCRSSPADNWGRAAKDRDVIDETPGAYRAIDAVMAAQRDLVEVIAALKALVCVKLTMRAVSEPANSQGRTRDVERRPRDAQLDLPFPAHGVVVEKVGHHEVPALAPAGSGSWLVPVSCCANVRI